MMRRENGRVLVDISEEEFNSLVIALGFALGAAKRDYAPAVGINILRLANTINEGNPHWTPYVVDER